MKTDIIENYVLEGIQKGVLSHKIETEDQLSERFRVSKITVRNAINNLVNQGYLRKIQGSGVYVAPSNESKIHINMNLTSFREHAKHESKVATSQVLLLKKIHTPVFIQQKIKDTSITDMFYYERINFFDDHGMAYEQGYIRSDLFPELKKKDLERSKYQYFAMNHHTPSSVTKTFIPMIATDKISKGLRLQGKPPLVAIENTVYSQDSTIIEITTTFYNPDKFCIINFAQIK